MSATGSVLQSIFPQTPAERLLLSLRERQYIANHGPLDRLPDLASSPILASGTDLIRSHKGRVRLHLTGNSERYRNDVVISTREALAFYDQRAPSISICLEAIEASIPAVSRLLDCLAQDFGIPRQYCSSAGFISPPKGGLPLHFDCQEVLALQIVGKKVWRVAPNSELEFPSANYIARNTPAPLEAGDHSQGMPSPNECQIIEMKPGSALFLPRGYWHATTSEEESISLTFVFATPSWGAVFLERLKATLVLSEHWRAPAVHFGGIPADFLPSDFAAAMDRAIAVLMSGELNDCIHDEVRRSRLSPRHDETLLHSVTKQEV